MTEAAAARRWIVSPAYDLVFFFGGAAASLCRPRPRTSRACRSSSCGGRWILAFDGPHIAAAFTRTYLDREEWRRRPLLLRMSLLAFAAGRLCPRWSARDSARDEPFQLFLGLAVFYAYYHVVRQHYGFLALYRRERSGARARLPREPWALYVGCWAPYAYFLLTHASARARRLRLAPSGARPVEHGAGGVLVAAWLAAAHRARGAARGGARRVASVPTVRLPPDHASPCTALIYFVVAPAEPVYARVHRARPGLPAHLGPGHALPQRPVPGPRLVPQPQSLRRRRATSAPRGG